MVRRIEFADDDKTRDIQPLLDALYENVLTEYEPAFFISDEATIYDLATDEPEELIQRLSDYYRTVVTRADLAKPLWVLLPELERQRTGIN